MRKTNLPLTIIGKTFGLPFPSLKDYRKRTNIKDLVKRIDGMKKRGRVYSLLVNKMKLISSNVPKRGWVVGVLEFTDIVEGDTVVTVTDYCRTQQEAVKLFRQYNHEGQIASYIRLTG
jgi:hypothetical protein